MMSCRSAFVHGQPAAGDRFGGSAKKRRLQRAASEDCCICNKTCPSSSLDPTCINGHIHHAECISQWIQISHAHLLGPTCPDCRSPVIDWTTRVFLPKVTLNEAFKCCGGDFSFVNPFWLYGG